MTTRLSVVVIPLRQQSGAYCQYCAILPLALIYSSFSSTCQTSRHKFKWFKTTQGGVYLKLRGFGRTDFWLKNYDFIGYIFWVTEAIIGTEEGPLLAIDDEKKLNQFIPHLM